MLLSFLDNLYCVLQHLPFPSDDRTLNVGLIGHHKKMQFVFTLTNSNPVELPLLELTTSLPMSELEICGCGVGDHGHIIMHNSFENLTKCVRVLNEISI